MAKTVTLIKENPKRTRNPKKRKSNPAVAVPVAGTLNFPSVQNTVGLVAGGSAAVFIPTVLQRFLGNITAPLGDRIGPIANIFVAWGTNLWIAKQLRSSVKQLDANAFQSGANTVHALQLVSALMPGQNVLGVKIPSVSGVKRSNPALPAPAMATAAPMTSIPTRGRVNIGTAQSQTDPVTGDEAFISVT